MARIVSDGLSRRLGQPVIVEAKPGAGGNLAADAVAKSTPDGYTIGLVTGAHAISGALYKQLAYSPTDSFDMLSTMVYYALVIAVRADHKAKTLADLIAIAKAKPDDLSYGSVGFGSTHHLAGELLNITAGTKMVHVPYRGDSLTVTSLLAGDVPVIVGTTVLLAGQIESGAIRGLAVTSAARTKLLPNVPSAQEAGVKGFDVRTWAGLLVSKGTPPDIVETAQHGDPVDAGRPRDENGAGDGDRRRGPRQHAGGNARADHFRNRQMVESDQRRRHSAHLSPASQSAADNEKLPGEGSRAKSLRERDEAIHLSGMPRDGLLRFARNAGLLAHLELAVGFPGRDDDVLGAAVGAVRVAARFVVLRRHHVDEGGHGWIIHQRQIIPGVAGFDVPARPPWRRRSIAACRRAP